MTNGPTQLDLLPPPPADEAALFLEMEQTDGSRNPEFTADRYRQQHPAQYDMIVRLYYEIGLTDMTKIAGLMRASWSTVRRVVEREAHTAAVEGMKKKAALGYRMLGEQIRGVSEAVLVELSGKIHGMKGADLAAALKNVSVAAGVFEDKAQVLSGGPTQRVAIEVGTPGHDATLAFLRDLEDESRGETRFRGDGGAQRGPDGGGLGGGLGDRGEIGRLRDGAIEGEIVEDSGQAMALVGRGDAVDGSGVGVSGPSCPAIPGANVEGAT
jgi:hypothetical protein